MIMHANQVGQLAPICWNTLALADTLPSPFFFLKLLDRFGVYSEIEMCRKQLPLLLLLGLSLINSQCLFCANNLEMAKRDGGQTRTVDSAVGFHQQLVL